jgi:hypothetical protein
MAASQLLLKERVEAALQAHVTDLREEVIQDAVKEFETRLRATIARATLNLADMYSVEYMGNILQIRVQMENKQ